MRARALIGSWAVSSMLLIGGVGGLHDLVVLLAHGTSVRAAIVAAASTVALTVLIALVLCTLAASASWLARRWGWVRLALPALLAADLSWTILQPTRRLLVAVYVGMVVATALTGALLGWLSARQARWARAAAAAIGVGAIAFDHLVLRPTTYSELHHLAQLVWVGAALSAGVDLRRRIEASWRGSREIAALAALAFAASLLLGGEALAPRWRASAVDRTLALAGVTRAARTMVDLDRDGFSPVAWGGDCDDLDGDTHPRVIDRPGGGDANCNGVDPPTAPTAADVGFTAAFGDPVGRAQLVLLVSVDTLRADALDPGLMPRTFAFAGRGVRFERMYATSPSTFTSLPFLVREGELHPPIGEALVAAGVATTAIYGGIPSIDRRALGFQTTQMIPTARGITAAALARLGQLGDRRELLWLHYVDPHEPYAPPEPTAAPAVLPHLPEGYRADVAYTDVWLGELFAGLDRLGLTDRTVVVFTADHGEAFGEYGQHNHGRTAYDAVLRVPGFVVAPGLLPAVHPHLVSHRDVVSTLLGAAGLAPPERFGRSWLRLRAAPTRPLHDWVFARSSRFASGREVDVPLAILVEGDRKLVVDLDADLAVLHPLGASGSEAIDLAAREPAWVAERRRRLALFADLDAFPAVTHAP